MATYNLTGTRLTWDSRDDGGEDDLVIGRATTRLSVVATDDYRQTYQYIGDGDEADILVTRGTAYQFFLDGQRLTEEAEFYVFGVEWDGKSSDILIMQLASKTYDVEYVFQIAGDPLEGWSSVAGIRDFMDSITDNGTLTTADSFGPGEAMDLRNLTAFSGVNHNDVLIANGRYDDWAGQTIRTGRGNDRVEGVSAHDRFHLGTGNDTGKGGSGNDTILGESGRDRLLGQSGADRLNGGGAADTLLGGSGNDRLEGRLGADSLSGGGGDDTLLGGAGSDRLNGGGGDDRMTGGGGNDVFIYRAGSGADVITDFTYGVDQIGFGGISRPGASVRQVGEDAVFDFGNGNTLTVLDRDAAEVREDIFIL